MEITKGSPMKIDIGVISESTVICELKINGTKSPIKVNVDFHIYYKHPLHSNMTDVVTSGIQSVYTSSIDSIHKIKMKIPRFKDCIKSCVYVSIDSNENPYRKIHILSIIVEDIFKYEQRKIDELKTKAEKLKERMERLKSGKLDIVCQGLMLGDSGFAKAMRNITLGLDSIGCNIRAIPLDADNTNFLGTEKGKKIQKLTSNNIDPYFWITMNNPMGVGQHYGSYSIGYAMFETENFPLKYAQHLNNLDEIWTPSTFCKDSMIRSGVKSVLVMPLGVNTEQFDPKKVEAMICPKGMEGKYKFLAVCGYSERKGISILVRSFAEEFSGDKNVVLYIKGGWYNKDKAQIEINNITKDIENCPLIHLDFNIYPDDTLAQIYKMCDCFVLPTRGEGWGLPFIEAMSMGMPTIGTNWGGQLEFMDNNNSFLINIDGTATEPRCDWICSEYIGGKFAVPNKNHLRQLMRYIYEHKEYAKEKGRIAREYIANNFSWKISCNRMYERLKSVADATYKDKEPIILENN